MENDTNGQLREVLVQYRQIERQLEALNLQKQALREHMQELLTATHADYSWVELPDERIRLALKHTADIRYDEDLLRKRLWERYRCILAPDPKKLRAHLDELSPVLAPYLDSIGSPSRARVEMLVKSGDLTQEDFKGAFVKTHKTTLYVSHQHDLAPQDTGQSRTSQRSSPSS